MHIQRLLIVATCELADVEELPPGVFTLIRDAREVFVLAPTQPGRLHWLFTDVDEDRAAADERLSHVLAVLRSAGVRADGEVGADMPGVAIDDAIRRVRPDHVLCAVPHARHRDWQHLERAEREHGIPMTLFELETAAQPVS